MTPHSHLDHFHAHVRTQGSKKLALQTTHCWADLFKSQELCLSFPYILHTETFGSERRCFLFFFFFPQLFAVCICTYMTSTCLCQVARFIDLNETVLQAIRACRWCKIQLLNSHYILSGMNSQPLSPPVVWPSPVFPHFLIFPLHLFFFVFALPCHLLAFHPLPPPPSSPDLSPTAKTSAEEDTRAAGRPRHHASWVTSSRRRAATYAGTRRHLGD